MGKILVGLLIILLEFNIHLDTMTIGIFPDFLGYIILILGLREMLFENSLFQKIIYLSIGMAIYSAVCYLIDLIGITDTSGLLVIILGLINTICTFYIIYLIIKGIEEIQIKYEKSLYADNLNNIWRYLLVLNAAMYLTIPIPILSFICIIFSFVATIVLLCYIYKAKEEYYGKILK